MRQLAANLMTLSPGRSARAPRSTALRPSTSPRSILADAAFFGLGVGVGLRLALGWPLPAPCVVRACAQVDEKVVHVAGNVLVRAERRHHAFLRSADALASARDHAEEISVAQCLERILQRRRIGRAFAVRPMADMTFGVIAAVARVSVPVDRPIRLDLVGWIAVLIEVLAVFLLHRGRIA